jgi:hypothetical protein
LNEYIFQMKTGNMEEILDIQSKTKNP